jgi:hypothetical protein
MLHSSQSILSDPTVCAALWQAWQDSSPGSTGGHEEGGFVVQDANGTLRIVRWSKGSQDSIVVLPHPDCRINEEDIVASFHTHPNTGGDFVQEPGETDKRAVRDDPDLKGTLYIGELVISQATVYLITPQGQVREVGETQVIFTEV